MEREGERERERKTLVIHCCLRTFFILSGCSQVWFVGFILNIRRDSRSSYSRWIWKHARAFSPSGGLRVLEGSRPPPAAAPGLPEASTRMWSRPDRNNHPPWKAFQSRPWVLQATPCRPGHRLQRKWRPRAPRLYHTPVPSPSPTRLLLFAYVHFYDQEKSNVLILKRHSCSLWLVQTQIMMMSTTMRLDFFHQTHSSSRICVLPYKAK